MSRLISVAALQAVTWFETLRSQGIDLTDNAHIKVEHEAQEFCDEPSLEEAADVIISVIGACHARGWTLQDLGIALLAKMQVNRSRQWERQSDGTYQHR